MRVLLRLGHVQLRPPALRERRRQRHLRPRRREGHRVVPVLVVLRERRQPDGLELAELGRELARAVGPEVEEDRRVAVADPSLVAHQRGLDELVGLVALVRGAHRLLAGGRRELGLALHDRVVGELGAVPALVAVHRVVAARDGGHARAAPGLHLREVAHPAVGARVAAVGEGVDHDVRHVLARGEVDERPQVVHARVHAAVRHQPEQVEAVGVAGGPQRLVLEERAVLDRLVDAEQVLLHDRARSQVEVAHLRVAHLALGEADRRAVGRERGVRMLLPELVEHRRVRQLHGVPRARLGQPPPVEHDQADARNAHGAAAATISAKPFGSRLAPPTSAPSTSGWARISAALSGFTLPP